MKRVLVLLLLLILFLPGSTAHRAEGNLTLSSMSASVNAPQVGEQVTFWLTVLSTQQYWDVKVGVYVDYHLVLIRDIPYIDGRETLWFKWSFNESGTHNVTVVVDYKNEIHETNERDNTKSLLIVVKRKPLPDLTVNNIRFSKEVVFSGETLTAYFYLYSANATAYDIPVMIYLDNKNYSLRHVPVIPANESYVLTASFALGAGTHTIGVFVNYGMKINESKYDNNYLGKELTVYSKSLKCNIWVDNVSVSNFNPYYGEGITVYAHIHNTGDFPITNVLVAVFYDEVLQGIAELPEIADNSTYVFMYHLTAYGNASVGTHTISIFADYENRYNETDENDNTGSVNITVNAKNNTVLLTPADIMLSASELQEGMTVTVYAQLYNPGNFTVPAHLTMGVDNETVKSLRLNVSAHRYFTTHMLWSCVRGWHQIWVSVDNITVFRTVWVSPTMAVVGFVNSSFTISAPNIYVGEKTWLAVKIENVGKGVAQRVGMVFMARLNDSYSTISVKNITLLPHALAYIQVPWVPEREGNYTLSVNFIPSASLNFLNFNQTLNATTIYALSELKIWRVSYVMNGHVACLNITVNNTGVVSANNFYVAVIANGVVVNKTYISSLPAHYYSVLHVNATLGVGENIVTVDVDYRNRVREYNESNNNYTLAIYVAPNNAALYAAIATVGIVVAVLAIGSFFLYTIRAFVANIVYGFLMLLMSLWITIREREPFSKIRESFDDWVRERQ